MRIALVCPNLPPKMNACGDATDRLARELLSRGDDVLVITDNDSGSTDPYRIFPIGATERDCERGRYVGTALARYHEERVGASNRYRRTNPLHRLLVPS